LIEQPDPEPIDAALTRPAERRAGRAGNDRLGNVRTFEEMSELVVCMGSSAANRLIYG
jgi:hypothetical protein